jgi:hypothetical protein
VQGAGRVAGEVDADRRSQQLEVNRCQLAARQVQQVAGLPPALPRRGQFPQHDPRHDARDRSPGLLVVFGRLQLRKHLPQLRQQALSLELLVPDPPRLVLLAH